MPLFLATEGPLIELIFPIIFFGFLILSTILKKKKTDKEEAQAKSRLHYVRGESKYTQENEDPTLAEKAHASSKNQPKVPSQKKAASSKSKKSRHTTFSKNEVQNTFLLDPDQLKEAIILKEIIDKPLGLR